MRALAIVGLLAILAAVGVAVFTFGGYMPVGAQGEDPALVKWALVKVRSSAIRREAVDRPPADFQTPARVQAGARAFAARGCVNCHGGPGVEWAKFSEGLNPSPPDLKEVADDLSPAEVFWVVKNGIRMTGMPSFAAAGVADDEIWSLAAFVKALPKTSDADYKTWTAAP
ncbi:cytochrome c [Alsobacter sp. SYSU M60028]|uniref:Cytochrome c n=1 Tax=Alsobacter ponti TaxID=2962936 RepID=A0ABT1LD64_9HYPH|nr:cytochrome c [Alsobacter ponti]MCP8939435.1 cytochrome c [Alsobacter ponti]